MATVVLTPIARQDLETLVRTHSLPTDTLARFKRSIASLESFPMIGTPFHGRWDGYRFILGPWRWMLVVYVYDEFADRGAIVTIQDARSSRAGR